MEDFLIISGVIVGAILIYYTIKRLFPWFKREFSYNLWPGTLAQIVELSLIVFLFDVKPPWKMVMLVTSVVILIVVSLFNIAKTKVTVGILATFSQMIVAAGIVFVVIILLILIINDSERRKKKNN